jgi:septal ring-binding cell division protein DamX
VTLNCRENRPQRAFSRLATVRQLAAFALTLVLGAIAALALVSCGGGEDAKLLPGATAKEISENLDSVKQFVSEEECVGAQNAAQEVSSQVEALGGVDPKLKQALQRGAAKLGEVVAACEETETEAVAPAGEASTEEEDRLPPGLEKKAEKEREKEEKALEKEEEKQEKEVPPVTPTTPTETTPAEPPTTPTPPSEGGGTGAPGGVGPGAAVEEGD